MVRSPSLLLLCGLALSAGFASLSAQQQDVLYSVQGGATIPHGSVADELDTGFHVVGVAEIDRGIFPRFVRGEVGLHLLRRDDEEQQYISVSGALRIPIAEVRGTSAYLVGGLGFYRTSFTRSFETIEGQASGASVDFGANGGVGFERPAGPVRVFGEVRVHSIAADRGGERLIPVGIGIRF